MSRTTRTHSPGKSGFAEFQASTGRRRPSTKLHSVEVVVIGQSGQVGSALLSRLRGLAGSADRPPLRLAEAAAYMQVQR